MISKILGGMIMEWFARLRRRRRYADVAVMFEALRVADGEQQAGVTGDPEYEAWIAGLRAKVADLRASPRRGGYSK